MLVTNMKKLEIVLIILCSLYCTGQKQKNSDTLKGELSKFYAIRNLVVSDDSKWSSIKKEYSNNVDTVLVFKNAKPEQPVATLIGLNQKRVFLKNNKFFASGNNKALLLDLVKGKGLRYQKVKSAEVLSAADRYFIHYNDQSICVYDGNGKVQSSAKSIDSFPVTDNVKNLFILKTVGDTQNIVDLSDSSLNIYHTTNRIIQMEISNSGNYLMLVEKIINTGLLKPVLINLATKAISYPYGDLYRQADAIKFSEIQKGESFLIDFQTKNKVNTELVDIWYGNDSNLKAKDIGCIRSEYYLWNTLTSKCIKIPNDRFPSFAAINNKRFLLSFDPVGNYNYVTYVPLVDYYLYDIITGKYCPLSSKTSGISHSPNGQYLVLLNEADKDGRILDLDSGSSLFLPPGLHNPVFSLDGNYIFFNGMEDFWWFKTETMHLNRMGEKGKISSILNVKRNPSNGNYSSFSINIDSNTVDLNKGLLLTLKDNENRSSILSYKNGNFKVLHNQTLNYISEIKTDPTQRHSFLIEENYNLAPRLIYTSLGKIQDRVIYQSNKSDRISNTIKQEIVHYKNKDNEELKGVLYYPIHFDPKKKYPMIVQVYEKQSTSANKYPVLGISFIGYDRRSLLRRGYFVYEPDISISTKGMGVSALDCVDKALDAVSVNSNINMAKVGLTGHSFGSYETNFIATQSKRFAAYISSSGFSDIVRAYFSYNYNFKIAEYARIENGQHQMPPFSENKEQYYKNNPINFVDQVNAPILLWAGMKDKNVPWQHTQEFYIGLKRNGKQVIAVFYPNQSHTILNNTPEAEDLQVRILEWWDYFLKDHKNATWIDKQLHNKKGCTL
ncbi:hypothetical protein CLA01_12950 [Chryseobacterium lathyri]|uniref:Peptidase S9 prolyl oligopeptidase catalytic domain-containing protein n=2 Tax=Chryseobacterium lathyri TaxID=395933 RepID=A0A511Y7S0_9FLAO|nr:hypothetical protein CLA01_12950 [Chryseobacterium lathyri]